MNDKRSRPSAQRRSAARLAAVQALYQLEATGAPIDIVLNDFLEHGLGSVTLLNTDPDDETAEVEETLAKPDKVMFAALVRGTVARLADFDAMVGGALTTEWSVDRLEAVLRAVLRAGAYELSTCTDVPVRVVISEWMDVAKAFYSGPEPKLVNAVLDRIARVVRADELSGNAGDR